MGQGHFTVHQRSNNSLGKRMKIRTAACTTTTTREAHVVEIEFPPNLFLNWSDEPETKTADQTVHLEMEGDSDKWSEALKKKTLKWPCWMNVGYQQESHLSEWVHLPETLSLRRHLQENRFNYYNEKERLKLLRKKKEPFPKVPLCFTWIPLHLLLSWLKYS